MPLKRKTKINPLLPVDYAGLAGKLLRGTKIYGGGGTSPNPTGFNQHRKSMTPKDVQKAAQRKLRR